MRSVINITGIIDDDVSTGTISYLLDTVGVSKVDIKTYPQFDDWKESLPAEPIAGLSAACLRWIHSWGNGGGDRSSETMITEVIRELNSDAAPELADAIFGNVSGYSKSEFDAQGLTIELINGCIEDLCEEKSAGVTGIRGNQLLMRRKGQSSAATGKKLRLLLFEDCHRNCPGCCNKDFELSLLPVCHSFQGYDLIMLTGGEPMLYPAVVMDAIRRIRLETTAPIILYTALTADKEALSQIMQQVNGLTVTLHDNADVKAFLEFDDFYCNPWKIAKSFRLNIFKGVEIDLGDIKGRWKVKSEIEWIKNCPLPEGEILMRFNGNPAGSATGCSVPGSPASPRRLPGVL